jgi:hypothetical protein
MSKSNRAVYHVLAKQPALYKEQMPIELEELALQLVLMGRLRIDADEQRNFVRYTCPFREVNIAFSNRELTDPMLKDRTMDILVSIFSHNTRNESPKEQARAAMEHLQAEAKNNFLLSLEKEMQIARIVVQCAHPAVIMLMIAEGIEVFITYGVMVGDVMDVVSWQAFGSNSGLQSTDGRNASVFVACAGNPLLIPSKDEVATYVSDGYSALARMMIVAGQEIGHYSEIIRDQTGRYVARHSCNIGINYPTKQASKARKHDVDALERLRKQLLQCGIQGLITSEASVRFFRRRRRFSILAGLFAIQSAFLRLAFKLHCYKLGISPWKDLVKKDSIGSQLLMAIDDMLFQLEPDVEAYRDTDPQVEEAVKCAEALARVPQQVIKWGHGFTKLCMPELYIIYYRDVVQNCQNAYQQITGSPYQLRLTRPRISMLRWLNFHVFKRPPKPVPLPYFRDDQQ